MYSEAFLKNLKSLETAIFCCQTLQNRCLQSTLCHVIAVEILLTPKYLNNGLQPAYTLT
jgi:hypothetical protein